MTPTRREMLLAMGAMALAHPGWRSPVAAMQGQKLKNPFLSGNFAPLREERTEDKLRVTGQIPVDLQGLFVRNGPNPQFDPLGNYHWFDGDGMLHGVYFRDGQASYRNRYVQTAGWQAEKKAGKAQFGGILDDQDIKKILAGEMPFKNAANTALVYHAKKLLALWEAGDPHEIQVPTLETVGPYQFAGALKHPFTAHPKIDPRTGEMLTFGYSPMKPGVWLSQVDARGKLTSTRHVPLEKSAMMHDFLMTNQSAIFPVCPQFFDMTRMAKGQSPWHFDEGQPIQFVVVSRDAKAGPPQTFTAKTGFAFHFLNASEQGDEISVLGCRFDRFPEAVSLGGKAEADPKPNPSALYRWVLNRKSGQLTEAKLDDTPVEFPRINEAFTGQSNRYGYVGVAEGDFFTAVRRYDLSRANHGEYRYGAGRFGGECVFVPRPHAKAEDEGWLMTFVYDQREEKSELLILDAQNLPGKALARVHLPHRVPYGFHGTWIAGV